MTLVAGIDEAGYGPLLGPLLVAASVYRLADGADEEPLNALVRDTAARERGLPTADSKLIYRGGKFGPLELSALGHLRLVRGSTPAHLGELVADSVVPCRDVLAKLPWYGDALLNRELPSTTTEDEIFERSEWHRADLAERGAEIADLAVAVLPVPIFNALTEPVGSKAHTLFDATARLIRTLVHRHPDEELVIHVDRQGGRIHYSEVLSQAFPMAPLSTLHERREESAYHLAWPDRPPVHIDFRVKADDTRAPVALASVLAKSLRELLMGTLNDWFVARVPDLRRTAGYGHDAQRFLLAVDRLVIESGATREDFVRCR